MQTQTQTKFAGHPRPCCARLVRPLIVALAVTFLIFGLSEIAEQVWFSALDLKTLHRLHTLRDIFSSLMVAGAVGWTIIRSSPALLDHAPVDETGIQAGPLTEAERVKTYAQWFIAMRWLAVLLAAFLVVISVRVVGWLPLEVWRPLSLTVFALAASNVLYMFLVCRGYTVPALLSAQAYFDLVILTTLLHFSGGIENPLSMMMILHVIIGGILLSRRQCFWIAIAASSLFALLAWAEWADAIEHYTLQLFPHFREQNGELFHPAHHSLYVLSRVVLQTVVMFLTAYFVTTLAERLRQNDRQLEATAERATAGQQLLQQALQTTGAGLRVLDGQLRTFWDNPQWQQWCACPPDRHCPVFESLDGPAAPARQTLQDGLARVTELVVEPRDTCPAGSSPTACHRRVLQVTTAPLRDARGNIQRIVELAQDITRQKESQEQMLRAGKLAAVGELAGRVAHEVNNPIAIISAKARLLLADHRREMSPKIAQELGKITDYADRVARIAQGLLSYCRPSPATRTRLDVRQPIRKSLAMVEQHARSSGVKIWDELADGLPLVTANAAELEQIFLNLFLNALDSMPRGGELKVSAKGQPVSGDGRTAIAVVVEDTGIGIPETIRDKIFEPFFTTKQEGRGTGLGLSICLGLVRSYNGEIKAESQLGQGSRFIVTLPASPPLTPEQTHG